MISKTGRIGTCPSKEKLEAIDLNGWGRGLKNFKLFSQYLVAYS
jgi:hypothetical protein